MCVGLNKMFTCIIYIFPHMEVLTAFCVFFTIIIPKLMLPEPPFACPSPKSSIHILFYIYPYHTLYSFKNH